MLFIPINIPVLNWILNKQIEIENRTYLKFVNNSSKDITIKLFDKESNKIVGAIRNNQSIVDYYTPTFLGEYGSTPVYDSLKIIVATSQSIDTIQLSEFYPGDCRRIYLEKILRQKHLCNKERQQPTLGLALLGLDEYCFNICSLLCFSLGLTL